MTDSKNLTSHELETDELENVTGGVFDKAFGTAPLAGKNAHENAVGGELPESDSLMGVSLKHHR